MITRLIVAILMTFACYIGIQGEGNPREKILKIRAIYPAGEEVATSDRITIEFNQNVVSLGASMFIDDVVPVDIEPAVDCEWNWVKLNTLQCELPIDTNLDSSTKYKVTVRPGIRAPNGQEMDEDYVHSFETIVPSITYAGLVSWRSSTQPIVDVSFNQSVNLESLQDRLFLYDTSSGKEIPVKICPSNWRLSSSVREDYFSRERMYQRFDHSDCDITGVNRSEVLMLPVEQLSPKSKVSVLLLPGVEGAKGNLTATNRVLVDTEITTFDEFRLLGLVCQDVFGNNQFLGVDETHDQTCKVRSNFSLVFSSRFFERSISKFVHIEPQKTREDVSAGFWRFSPERFGGFVYSIRGDFQSSTTYRVYVASAPQTSEESENIDPVQDGFGRDLVGTNEITFRTDRPVPKARVSERSVVVDSQGTVDPTISLGNVDDVRFIFDTLDQKGVLRDQTNHIQSPKQDDVQQAQFLELRTLLRSPSGVVSGKLVGQPRFDHPEETLESHFFAQATPYSVYLKLGTVDTLAWVVDIQTGEPVVNAQVKFYLGDPRNLAENRESIFSGKTNTDGLVSLPGYEEFDPHWERAVEGMFWDCRDREDCPIYFVRIEGKEGIALLPLDDDYQLYGAYFLPSVDENLDHFSTTSQNLYRPGDTVHIKGYVRTRRNEVRVIPDEGHFGLCIWGPRELRRYEISPITLNQFGAYHASVRLHNRTEFGEYRISLVFDHDSPVVNPCSHRVYEAGGTFEVFEFKTNPLRVVQDLNVIEYERGESLTITTQAELHAGGPYGHASGQLVVSVRPEDPPIETVSKYDYTISRNRAVGRWGTSLLERELQLNGDGRQTTTIESLDSEVYYGELRVESSVISDRGKSVATCSAAAYYGVDQFVAIKQPISFNTRMNHGQIRVGELWPIQVLVISKDDKIVSEKDVRITVYAAQQDPNSTESISWRSSNIVWEELFECTVVSAQDPVACDFNPAEKNEYRIDAQIEDTKGHMHRSSIRVGTYIDNRPRPNPVDRPKRVKLELICNSNEVDIGDTVRCEVKNHLGNSPILVTIERTSVIDEWLVRIDPKNPFIEFPVLQHYEPHFELSVLTVSPRSSQSNPDDRLYQIAREKFKLHNPRIDLLEISVASNRANYKPRDTVKLSLSVSRDPDRTKPIEYAVAVVDEAILDLSRTGTTFFDPTKKEWKQTDTGVRTYGLIAALLEKSELPSSTPTPYWDSTFKPYSTGSDYFSGLMYAPTIPFEIERKSDPNIRSVNRFIAYWNPSVVSNNGRLKLDFVLPDNLTSWKVLVMAVSADDRFGYASKTFASLKDTEIRAVVPNVVTEGDIFQIGASIINRADRRRRLNVELQATGNLVEGSKTTYERQLIFGPFERKVVTWDVEAGQLPQPLDLQIPINSSEIQVVARAGDRKDEDALDTRIPVRSNRVRVSSVVYGALDGDKTTIPIGIPDKVTNESGHLDFTMTTNEAINFDGVFRYAIEYPYACWEQELTQAILAMQYVQLEQSGTEHGIQWSDPEALIKRVLASSDDFQAPKGGMAYFVPRNYYIDPYLSAYTAIAFSWLEDAGYEIPNEVARKLIDYLREFLFQKRDDSEMFDWITDQPLFNHIQATVSAVVVHALAVAGGLSELELIHYSNHINQMDLFGLSHYLMASLKLDPTHPLNARIFERIMNHRALVDGAVEFVESVPRGFTRILHSDTRSLCSVLEALTEFSKTSTQGVEIGELNELSNAVRYARDNLPYWRNTQDNVFCTNAMIEYSKYIDSDIGELLVGVDLRNDETGESTRLAEGWQFNSSITQLNTKYSLQSQVFGSHGTIEINRQGSGTAFYNVELSYLTTVNERINRFSGFEIHREYVALRDKKWQILKPEDHIYKGEYVLVNLYLNNRFDRHHVVIDDSVPGGLEPVNLNLGTEFLPPYDEYELADILSSSELYQEFEKARYWSFRYRELGLQDIRFFAQSIRRGKYHLSWLGQAISAGEFTVLPTHVEEMYRPIMFGKTDPWILKVKP